LPRVSISGGRLTLLLKDICSLTTKGEHDASSKVITLWSRDSDYSRRYMMYDTTGALQNVPISELAGEELETWKPVQPVGPEGRIV
jgi:hypothetical protein